MTSADNNLQRAIGRMEGKLDAVHEEICQLRQTHQSLDRRLRHAEIQAAKYGGTTGAVVAVCVEMLKTKIGLGGG